MLPVYYKMLGHFAIITAAVGGLLADSIDFRNQITLGSVVVGVLILVVAGMITVRSKIATIWREEAEGERAAKERLQEELNEAHTERLAFEKEQQEIRHELKDKISELNAIIKVMEAKTDLTSVLEIITQNAAATQKNHNETHKLLGEIRDKLPAEPLAVNVVEDSTKEKDVDTRDN